ncbi:transcriptional regulator TACO1-like protein [Elsinoe ampelina]|uniref:Transcriptional regulator TACO1-like protein n=1 Tax=Elsinoe ampelina TaxID=302913 RepID=A0A6A6G0Z2_9PEZI|nr:transcriptional regulator TACO1-like protein [Elsinoe ampelina]
MTRSVLHLLAPCRSRVQCNSVALRPRGFHHSAITFSGHSRWSTIKHDKAKNDASKNKQRSQFAHEIATASKFFGPDPNANPRLADLIVKAKKNGFAKQSIEAAIARGQGKSATGAALEALTIEAIMPGNVGVVIDCETDSRARTLQNLRLVIKRHGGAASPSSYLFKKIGKTTFEEKEGMDADHVLETALEAGVLDVEEDADGRVVVLSEPNETRADGEAISKALGLEISRSEVVWAPNEDTVVQVDDADIAGNFCKFVEDLQNEDSTVQGVYMNITRGKIEDEAWEDLQSKVNV